MRRFLYFVVGVWLPSLIWAAPASIRVVLDDNYPPYSFRDAQGRPQGILKDMWLLWQERTGVTVDFQPMEWNKARTEMEAGRADVIDTIFATEDRQAIYDFSKPYATIEVPIYFHHSIGGITDIASLQGFTIGVKEGDACIEFLRHRGIQTFKPYPSFEALVNAAIRQDVRVLCVDQPAAAYFFNRAGAAADFRHAPPLYVGEFHWAVAKGQDELRLLLEDGFARINASERESIETRWLGQRIEAGLWPQVARYGGFVAVAIVLLLLWNGALHRRVGARTRELSSALQALKEREGQFRALFEQANDAIFIMRGSEVIDCNPRAESLYGMTREQMIGTSPMVASPLLQPNGRESAELLDSMVVQAQQGHPVLFEWRNLRLDGSPLDVEVSLGCIDFAGEPCLQAIVRDISERKRAEAEIERLAYFDPLTQLPNRRLLLERLGQALSVSGRSQTQGAILFIDLDNFKTLNDIRGHDFGDQLLKEVSQRLQHHINNQGFIARIGGDEFVVLLEGLGSAAREAAVHAEAMAQRLIELLAAPFLLSNDEYQTTASIGLCLFSGTTDETVDEILKRADAAMYQAKAAGRNTLCFFDPAIQASLVARTALETELRRALPQRQFFLVFQPQVDAGQRVIGAEALLRWQHPARGLVTPMQFIPLAEETGLIVPIGQWVLETACQQLRQWSQLPGWEDFRVSVNVSARQFRQPDFVRTVQDAITNAGINSTQLILELTESMVLDNMADSIDKMHALKNLGLGFSMDDFGTGYSSLVYLKRLPLDELKIDQSFVRDVPSDSDDVVIVRTIIAMGQSLGLTVVAEGVETDSQCEFLRDNGCEYYQGYKFGRPVDALSFVQQHQTGVL